MDGADDPSRMGACQKVSKAGDRGGPAATVQKQEGLTLALLIDRDVDWADTWKAHVMSGGCHGLSM
jgi:hypothetical protein